MEAANPVVYTVTTGGGRDTLRLKFVLRQDVSILFVWRLEYKLMILSFLARAYKMFAFAIDQPDTSLTAKD